MKIISLRLVSLLLLAIFLCFSPVYAQSNEITSVQPGKWDTDFADGLFVRGMYDAAIEEYERILTKDISPEQKHQIEFKIAEAYFKKNDFSNASPRFAQYVAAYPADSRCEVARFYLGMIAYMSSNFEEAIAVFTGIPKEHLDPKYGAMLQYYLARCYREFGKIDEAIVAFSQVTDTENSQLRLLALEETAAIYKQNGQLDLANQSLETIVQDYPENSGVSQIYLQLGTNYFERGDFDRSLANFEKAMIGLPADDSAVLYGLAKNYFQLGNMQEALVNLEKLQALNLEPAIRLEVEYLWAAAKHQLGAYEEAEAKLDNLLHNELDASFTDQIYLQAFWTLFELKDADKLDRYLQEFEQQYPQSLLLSEGFFLRAELYYDQGNFELASDFYQRALAINRHFRQADYAAFKYALCLKNGGKSKEGSDALKAMLQDYPDSSYCENALLELIELSQLSGDTASLLMAADQYVTRFDSGESLATVYMIKIQTEFEQKSYDTMKESLDHFLEKFPESLQRREAHYFLGWFYEKKEDYSAAVSEFNAALSFSNNTGLIEDAEILLQTGLSHYLAKEFDAALETFKKMETLQKIDILPLEMRLWMGEYLAEKKQWDSAINVYEALLTPELTQKRERVLYKLAEWSREIGRTQQAFDYYKQIVEGFPDSELFLFSRLGMADSYLLLNQISEAKSLYEQLVQVEIPYIKARATAGLGDIFYQEGNKEEAIRSYLFVAILFDDPMVPQLLFKALQANLELGRPAEAAKIFAELKERFPDSEWVAASEKKINPPPS